MGGDRINATVVFTDINSFTTMSHDMDATEVITFLNEYFEIMTEICMRHKGTLQSFLGDGLMIIFGAPVKMEDHALRACQMGIEMMEAQEALAKDRLEKGKQAYWIKIGINTGPVVAGNLGSQLRMEYTSIGDAVNMAARIQDATKAVGCDVLMSASTAELVKDQIDCIDRGGVKVKGVDEPIHVFEVVGIKGSTHPRPVFPGKALLKPASSATK
jgi:adenylate cyclase